MSKYTHNTLKLKIMLTLLLILVSSIWFALHSQPVQPVEHYAPGHPGYEVMRRKSGPNRSILVNLPNGNTLVWEVA